MERQRGAGGAAGAAGGSASIGDLLTARAVGLDRAIRFDTASRQMVSVPSLSDLMDVEIAPEELAPEPSVGELAPRAAPSPVRAAQEAAVDASQRGSVQHGGGRGAGAGRGGGRGGRRPRPPGNRAPPAVPGRARVRVNSDGGRVQRGVRAATQPRKAGAVRRPSATADTRSDGGQPGRSGGVGGGSSRGYYASSGFRDAPALGVELTGCGGASTGSRRGGDGPAITPPARPDSLRRPLSPVPWQRAWAAQGEGESPRSNGVEAARRPLTGEGPGPCASDGDGRDGGSAGAVDARSAASSPGGHGPAAAGAAAATGDLARSFRYLRVTGHQPGTGLGAGQCRDVAAAVAEVEEAAAALGRAVCADQCSGHPEAGTVQQRLREELDDLWRGAGGCEEEGEEEGAAGSVARLHAALGVWSASDPVSGGRTETGLHAAAATAAVAAACLQEQRVPLALSAATRALDAGVALPAAVVIPLARTAAAGAGAEAASAMVQAAASGTATIVRVITNPAAASSPAARLTHMPLLLPAPSLCGTRMLPACCAWRTRVSATTSRRRRWLP